MIEVYLSYSILLNDSRVQYSMKVFVMRTDMPGSGGSPSREATPKLAIRFSFLESSQGAATRRRYTKCVTDMPSLHHYRVRLK